MGVCIPEEYGGAGADFLSYILVLEELSRADAGVGVTVAVHTSAVTLPILTFGTDEQKARFVPPLARGEAPRRLRADRDRRPAPTRARCAPPRRPTATAGGSRARSSGSRTAPYAGTFLLFARTDAATPGPRGVSAFILDAEHVRITRDEEKLGLNSSVTNDLVVEDAQVGPRPAAARGGQGLPRRDGDARRRPDRDRGAGGRDRPGRLRRRAHYALERKQFGKRIAEFQAIQCKLADMATEIDAARLLVYRAAWRKQEGLPHTEEGAKAKLFASEMARRQTGEAIQILGGYGYTKEFPVERYYRDAKITEIYEGTSEIQRLVIARSILGLGERVMAQG